MGRFSRGKPMSARIWLTFVALCQVFLTPLVAFSLTYLVKFDFSDDKFSMSFDKEMMPWIGTASIIYGMVALLLALLLGGFTPISVVEKGGWKKYLGFSRSPGSASERRISRARYSKSPHGQISMLAHNRWLDGHSIISTHGGLILLAVPFQVMLATVPLAMVLLVPDTLMHENRKLELALILYLAILLMVMKYFPILAKRYIGIASFTRKWLISMTKISWLAPVLILWLMGRIASVVVIGWLGSDLELNIDFEKSFFETTLDIGSIPETSFLDLIAALAVIPLATFTTFAVLGAGSGDPPEWMLNETTEKHNSKDSIDSPSSLVLKGAQAVVTAGVSMVSNVSLGNTDAEPNLTLDDQKSQISEDSITSEKIEPENNIVEEVESLFDPNMFFDDDEIPSISKPSYDEPSITGLE
ncbi:MAG: hypothetical protein DWB99_02970 [Candidatus Poseidoniales archaeon]|nr:MAG: hypothetical protein DWB99_02970 [Candidatus Poseidoniales archaeon]|tara:strand:+ start:2711 stop:3955 length:1245 start_codon:yes stop_codon:yes gene_type:complete